jgi:hypothetical protein
MALEHLLTAPRERTLSERLQLALQLAEEGLDIARARLRREHPTFDEPQIEEALAAWLRDRPPPGWGCPGLRDAMHRFER